MTTESSSRILHVKAHIHHVHKSILKLILSIGFLIV
jgi:hypothetical protein